VGEEVGNDSNRAQKKEKNKKSVIRIRKRKEEAIFSDRGLRKSFWARRGCSGRACEKERISQIRDGKSAKTPAKEEGAYASQGSF